MSKPGEKSNLEQAAETTKVLAGTAGSAVELNNGDTVDIYICKTKNTGVVLQAAHSLMVNLGVSNLEELPSIDIKNPTVFLQLIAKSSEDIFLVASELCSLSYEELMELELDDTIKIILQVVTINKDFFSQKLLPLLQSVSLE